MSELGVDLGIVVSQDRELISQVLSAAGLADDVGLLTSSVSKLKVLLHITKMYCDRFQVKLVGSKAKLLVFTTNHTEAQAEVELAVTTLSVEGHKISPSSKATQVES